MGSSRVREPLSIEIQEEKGLGAEGRTPGVCVQKGEAGRIVHRRLGRKEIALGRTSIRNQGTAYRNFRYKP